jgi:PAS domain S-box-containing protein
MRGVCNLANPVKREAVIIAVPFPPQNSSSITFLGEVLSSAPEAIAITSDSSFLHINPEFTRLFGYSPQDAIGKRIDVLILPEHFRQEQDELYTAADKNGRASIETVRRTLSGEVIDVAVLVSPVIVKGEQVGYYASYRDIRDHKRREEKLQNDALHDSLTGLANSTLFLDPQDPIARLGGDELAVLLENIGSPNDCGELLHVWKERSLNPYIFQGTRLISLPA